ncbi:MAG: prepilin-type N-terminal cleavage/methylation domain-containing protein [Planctomycetota bacterium]
MERRAFTLLELLVVISIVAMLTAILLPALAQASKATKQTQCSGNQKQLYAIWTAKLGESNKGRFPRTYNRVVGDTLWFELLKEDYAKLRSNVAATPDTPSICPTVDVKYDRPSYESIYTGYAINCRWGPGSVPGDNEMQPFHAIVTPSSYPLFSEAAVHPSIRIARSYIGSGSSAFGRWGLEMPHGQGVGISVFADGHASGVSEIDLQEVDSDGFPLWFFN